MNGRVESATGSAAGSLACPECATATAPADLYCEACGASLCRTAPTHRVPGRSAAGDVAGDRTEIDLGPLGGVSDRGLVHESNEDGMAMALRPVPVVVVCDGVSTAPQSGPAARAAAAAAVDSLTSSVDLQLPDAEAGQPSTVASERALVAAATAAQQAVLDRPVAPHGPGPACTFVAAVVVGDCLTVGWLGDSRVYLFGTDGPARLTEDDTLAAQRVRAGVLPPEAAETGPGAHTITRWLGRDNGGNILPHVASTRLTGSGRVVVCSDGLWNYSSPPEVLGAHVAALPAEATPIEVARSLTEVALRSGGRDNITVVVVDVDPPTTHASPT